MYRGELVELLDMETLRTGPRHAYTRQLIAAVPMPAGGAPGPLSGRI
jgi:peptide/nickel transport system ATP-binding protein